MIYVEKNKNLVPVLGAAVAISLIASVPVNAQESDPVQDVSDTVDSVGGITTVAAGIIALSLGVRLAVKQVNRVMTKG